VKVCADRQLLGAIAGEHGAAVLRERLVEKRVVRVIFACAPSQDATLSALLAAPGIDWRRVHAFHMDEYIGLPDTHPASFRRWLKEHLADKVPLGAVEYLCGDAADAEAECRRYADCLAASPVDVCFLGIGENGHIAFNDPPVADFDDPRRVKIVTLDEACRAQQTAEGHFPTLADVPRQALTLTCPALLAAEHLIASVPGPRKAQAVRQAVQGPRSTACPASAIMDHPRATVYLDAESAGRL
jgi:glucosamine-6-phosphate deaminase